MLRNIFPFIFIFTFNFTFSQNYVEYYSLCNTADSLSYIGKENEALDKYKEAFKTVKFVHSIKSKKAYELAIKTNSFEDAFNFGKISLISSGKRELIKTNSRKFKKSAYYKMLKDSSAAFILSYNERINHDYIKIIDSLAYIDQRIIRHNRFYKGNYHIDKTKLPVNLFDLDSSNWNLLYTCIQEMGFPSEENVGSTSYREVWLLLHHNLRLKENTKYHEEIFEFIRQGEYLPEDMMVWYEQYYLQVNNSTFFTTWDENISDENLARIDYNRRKFYLKGINSYTLKKNGRSMIPKW